MPVVAPPNDLTAKLAGGYNPAFLPGMTASTQYKIVNGVGLVPMNAGGNTSAYGSVPAQTTTVNPSALWGTVYPNLSADLNSALGITRSQLAGELTPEVQRAVTNAANARAVAGGVGGSPFAGSVIARDLGLTTMDLQNRGVQNLQGQISGINQNLVQPSVDLAQSNAILASAPNPAAAAAEQQRVYEQQQQRSFERQQQLMNQQFQQQMSYLSKYLPTNSAGGVSSGAGNIPKAYGVTYTMPGASTPYYSNITYR